jgi:hypothetical protein
VSRTISQFENVILGIKTTKRDREGVGEGDQIESSFVKSDP